MNALANIKTLPGIGAATAERITAKIRRKMAKFALMVPPQEGAETHHVQRDIVDETFQILVALGHTEADARQRLDTTLATKKKYKDVEALLQAVYEQANE